MALKTITFGPKEILQGISPLQQFPNTIGGFFATATAIDYYRYPGMIIPGPLGTAFTGATITETPKSVQVIDTTVSHYFGGYLLTTGKLYQFFTDTNALTSNATFPHPLSGVTVSYPHSIIRGQAYNGTVLGDVVFYFTDGDIGIYDRSTCTDTWGSTVPTGRTPIATSCVHRAVNFNGIIYFTNSNYIGYYDPTVTTQGTLNNAKLQMPKGYTAQEISVVGGNLQIVADNGFQAIVVTWDGSSTLPESIENLDDSAIAGTQNVEGFPHIVTTGRGYGPVIRKKNYFGYPQVQTIQGTTFNQGTITSANGQLFLGDTLSHSIWSYGTPFAQYSYRGLESQGAFAESLSNPFRTAGTVNCLTVGQNGLIAASTSGGVYYLESFPFLSLNSYNNQYAQFRTNDTQLPNDSTIEQLIIYSNAISANAAFTPSITVDGNTAAWTGEDMTSATLDANGKSKTYFVGGLLTDMFAVGGSWVNSTSNTVSVMINKIDVLINTK